MIELYVRQRVDIKPGATVKVCVNGKVKIPIDKRGVVEIRKSFAYLQGLSTPFVTFPPGWEDTPNTTEILLTNTSPNTVELRENEHFGRILFFPI